MNGPSCVTPAAAEFGALLKRFRQSRHLSVDELGMLLGITGNYVYMMERGVHAPAASVEERFRALSAAADIYSVSACAGAREREVPVISWAQAGRATCFEELPLDWQDTTRSTCPDLQAFGIRLRGDSMEPQYHEGETIIAMPNCPPKHGCLVLAKLVANDGVTFKRFGVRTARPHHFRLTAFNRKYPPCELTWDQVHWVYPAYCAQEPAGRKAA